MFATKIERMPHKKISCSRLNFWGFNYQQANLKYNVANATGSEAFDLTLNAEPVISGGECSMQKLTICSRYKMADEETNMALLEIGMVSGYVPDKPSLHALLEESTTSE